MNRPIVVAQLRGSAALQDVRVIKVAKPGEGQAHTIYLGYEQKFKVDLSAIANEKITLVHVGEKLIILFDNKSTVTIDPFFDSSTNSPRANISFDVNGREIDASQFAQTFPVTNDQSVLPAAGEPGAAAGTPRSGANFRDASVDPFATPNPLDLLGQEELGTFVINDIIGPLLGTVDELPNGDDVISLLVDDQNLPAGSAPAAPVTQSGTLAFTAGSQALTTFAFGNLGGLSPALIWAVSANGTILTGSDERGAVVQLTLTAPGSILANTSGVVTVTVQLLANFDTHPGLSVDDLFNLGSVTVVASDASGDTAIGTVTVGVSDDLPTLTVAAVANAAAQLATELDETVGVDRYNIGEVEDAGGNANTDDAGPGLGQVTTTIAGGLTSLFAIGGSANADGPGTITSALSLVGIPSAGLATNLAATNGGAVTLFLNGGVIEGRDTTNQVVFTIAIVGNQLQTTLFEALNHGAAGNLFDNEVVLAVLTGAVQLQYTVTRTDSDGDQVTQTAAVNLITANGSSFSFDDDGPTLTVTANAGAVAQLLSELDETQGPDRYNAGEVEDAGGNANTDDAGPGLAQVTTTVAGGLTSLFTLGGDFGSDGPGTLAGTLSFVGIPAGGLATNLTATNGGAITLFLNGGVIEGRDTTNQVVFTIAIVANQMQTTLFEALNHGADGNLFDSEQQLLLAVAGSVSLQYTVTRTDGDNDPITQNATISLITQQTTVVSFDDDGPTLTVTANAGAAAQLAAELDETEGPDRYRTGEVEDAGGNANTDDAGPGLAQVTSTVAGGLTSLFTIGGDFGSDLAGTLNGTLSFTGIPPAGVATNLSATNGGAITLFLNGGVIEGRDATNQVVFTIAIVANQLQTTLLEALNHGADGNLFDSELVLALLAGGPVQLQYAVTRTDGDGDQITQTATVDLITTGGSGFSFDDDGPTLTVAANAGAAAQLASELDETEGPDRYNTGEVEDVGGNANTDDAGPGLAQVTTTVAGGLTSLFTIGGDFGSDLAGTLNGTLSFVGIPPAGLATNLSATNGGAITLFLNGGVIEGRDTTSQVVFTIAIVANQLQTTLFEALNHGADGNLFDSELVLALLVGGPVQLEYAVTRTDGDGDQITQTATIDLITTGGSAFSFDDDGPTLTVSANVGAAAQLLSELDETEGPDRYNTGEVEDVGGNANTDDAGPGLAQVTTTVAGGLTSLFTIGGDFGSDLAGTLNGTLSFVGIPPAGLATNLSATNGGAITLFLNGGVIEGRDTTNQVVFTIAIVANQLQTTLFEALNHGADGNLFDSELVLALLANGPVQLEYAVTRTDGDGDQITQTATIDLITTGGSVFSFDDDGPTLTVVANPGAQIQIELDETEGPDRYNTGEVEDAGGNANTDDAGPGLGQVTTTLAGGLTGLFTVGGDFGSDLAGTLNGTLSFVGIPPAGLATNLSATNGGAITLFLNGGVIEGRDTTNQVVFTIAIVADQLQTTLFEALHHGADGNLFDSELQLLVAGAVQLEYSVTRTDGDGDQITQTATVDLISARTSAFSFDDDGPTLTVTANAGAAAQLASELDETEGPDRYNTGEVEDVGGNANTDDAGPGLAQVTTTVAGGLTSLFTIGGDFGSDLAGTLNGTLSFVGIPPAGLATNLSATNGGAITLFLNGGVIEGRDTTNQVVFTIAIVANQLQTTLFEALNHGADGNLFDSELVLALLAGGPVQLEYAVTRTDGDGDQITQTATVDLITTGGSAFSFDDDGPTLTVTANAGAAAQLASELDETEGPDRYNTGEVEDVGGNANTDDAGPGLAQVTTTVAGGLTSLFTIGGDFGSDLAGTLNGTLSFVGIPPAGLATNLSATNGGAITLFLNGGVIEGRDTTSQVVFTIAIVANQLQTTLFEALHHGADGNLFDSELVLALLANGPVQLEYAVTRTDGDNDQITRTATIDLITTGGSAFSFDDDGPTLTVTTNVGAAAQLVTEVDETEGPDRYNTGEVEDAGGNANTDDAGPGLGQVTTSVAGGLTSLFTVGGDFGSDLAGTLNGTLSFVGIPPAGLATNLSATNGGAVTLFLNGGVIEGRDTTNQVVFTIAIVANQLQTTLFEALHNGADGNLFDSEQQLLLAVAGSVGLQYSVTRTDGDGDQITQTATVELITQLRSSFSFDDDGPTLTVSANAGAAAQLAMELDETEGLDRYNTGEVEDAGGNANIDDGGPGLAQVATTVAGGLTSLFTVGGDFGSDLAGSLNGTLSFVGIPPAGLATNLSATNGGAITLFLNGGLIEGRDTTNQVVFTIEIFGNQLLTTLFEGLHHGADGNLFDSELVLALVVGGPVQLQYAVTRIDGDGDQITQTATIDLITTGGSGFSFDDDGPALTLTTNIGAAAQLVTEVDETEGPDRYNTGEVEDAGGNANTDDAGPGLGQVTTTVAGGLTSLFTVGGDFGSDLAGTLNGTLSFVGIPPAGLATNLSATNGGAITLFLNGGVIEGRDTTSQVVFTIAIVANQLQTTLFEALHNGADGSLFDSEQLLVLLAGGPVQLEYAVTRTDGDGDQTTRTATIDLVTTGFSVFTFDDDGPTLTVSANVGAAAQLLTEVDETEGPDRYNTGEVEDAGGNANTDDAGPGLGQVTTTVAGGLTSLFTVGGDFGSDLAGTLNGTLSFVGIPPAGLATNLSATNGGAITLFLNGGVIEGRDTTSQVVFTIAIVANQLQTTLFEALHNGADANMFDSEQQLLLAVAGSVGLQYSVTRTDGDGDQITQTATIELITQLRSSFSFDDDGPTLTVSANAGAAAQLAMELDETEGTERYRAGEVEDAGGNANIDDAGPGLAQVATTVAGGLTSLFTVSGDFGSDLAGTLNGTLSFVGIPPAGLATNLSATNGGAITLFLNGGLIEGRDTTSQVVFTIAIVANQLQTTLFEALNHGADANLFDSELVLGLLAGGPVQLQYAVTRIDGDGDQITQTATIDLITTGGSGISFDDDGPTLTLTTNVGAAAQLVTEVDETEGTDRYNTGEVEDAGGNANTDDAGPGLGQVTTTVAGGLTSLFTVGGDFGSDLAGSLNGTLSFIGIPPAGLATNLSATNGGAITLFLNGGVIEGRDTTSQVVFTIAIVANQLQTTLFEALNHADGNLFDSEQMLALLAGGPVQLQYAVTRTDGDNDQLSLTATIDLISTGFSVFTFDDDGPSLTVSANAGAAAQLAMELDETEGPDRYRTGEVEDAGGNANTDDAGPGLAQVTTAVGGGLTSLFTVGGDFGSDGAGTLNGTLSFVGIPPAGLATNLSATNGGAITLFLNGGVIEGRDTTSQVVFTIAIVGNQLQTTLFEALNHGADGNLFDAERALALAAGGPVQLQYAVTRTDADGDANTRTATIDLITTGGSGISFDDDGPTTITPDHAVLTNVAGAPIVFELDQDSSIANNYGSDGAGTVRFAASLHGASSGMTSAGTPITYSVSADGLTLTALAGALVVFTMVLDPVTATYTIDMNGTVDATTQINFSGGGYDFAGGNTDWNGFIPVGESLGGVILNNNSPDLLLTPQISGLPAGTVNTTANAGGIGGGGDGNNVGSTETFRIDFVTDLRGDPQSGPNEYDDVNNRDHDFDGHYTTNGTTAIFASTAGSTVNVAAYDDPDIAGSFRVLDDGGAPDPLTTVVINYNGGTQSFNFTAVGLQNFSATIGGQLFTLEEQANGSVNVGGVVTNAQIGIFTATGFNAVEYTYVSGAGFQIGQFATAVQSTDPVNFSVPIEVVDGDGDFIASAIGVTLTQSGQGIQNRSADLAGDPHTYTSTVANPHIIGSEFADTITGNTSANVLFGNDGNDTISGGDGNDVLIGGAGTDTLTGGNGIDRMIFEETGAANVDIINSYAGTGTNRDILDISALVDQTFSVGNTVSDFVRVVVDGGDPTDFRVQIDANGASGGANFVDVAVLNGYNQPLSQIVSVYFEGQERQITTV